jgi:hypothetical protein
MSSEPESGEHVSSLVDFDGLFAWRNIMKSTDTNDKIEDLTEKVKGNSKGDPGSLSSESTLPRGFQSSESSSGDVAGKLDHGTRERASFATKVFCRLCEEHKIKTCSWEKSPAWIEYVEGKIDEAELSRTAEANVKDFVQILSTYEGLETPVVNVSIQDQKTRRARIANKIYRNACTTSGLNHCFFRNFAAWSEYVNGTINEDSFIESAIFEVLEMKENGTGEKL